MPEALRICTTCPVHHVENCPDCFGFGLVAGCAQPTPIRAEWAGETLGLPEWIRCETCGGTPAGFVEDGDRGVVRLDQSTGKSTYSNLRRQILGQMKDHEYVFTSEPDPKPAPPRFTASSGKLSP